MIKWAGEDGEITSRRNKEKTLASHILCAGIPGLLGEVTPI